MVSLTRSDIVAGLRSLVEELRSEGERAGIRLVGGAALSLRHFERDTTQDLDLLHVSPGTDDAVAAASDRVAERYGWAPGWVSFAVENIGGLPAFGRREARWETVFDEGDIVIEVASAETMLAMKLRAGRPGRDTDDIRKLLRLCEVRTLTEVEDFYEDFYPGEAPSDRTIQLVRNILSQGLPAHVVTPGPLSL